MNEIMKTYEFTIRLKQPEVTDADCDALYKAGCDDSTVVTKNGTTCVIFDREAASLEEAIRSATADVRKAGFDVARVEMDALV